jgi:hypothetical protein
MPRRPPAPSLDDAQTMALEALAFLAEDGARLGRFLALTGLSPQQLAKEASEPHLQAAVLEHVLGDESLLLVFTSQKGIAPDQVAPAHALLTGGGRLG